uniref:Secreted protein n=1 Tax=Oryza punctata TaxID=4537 RepID=A0A0E0M5P4_ORYPU
MKWAAAAAAASAAATAVASAAAAAGDGTERRVSQCSPNPTGSPASRGNGRRRAAGAAEDRFAPRFDGLRFIETLVTAHR